MQPLRLLFVVFASASVFGCTSATRVQGPDGEQAHLIKCSGYGGTNTESCYAEARELCPGGYVLRSSAVHGAQTEILVSCKEDLPVATTSASLPSGNDAARDDMRVCEAASKRIEGFKAYWVKLSGDGKPLAEMPEARDFVAACRAMPENVQRCMHDSYRGKHVKACDAVLTRLARQQRDSVDALFLEAR